MIIAIINLAVLLLLLLFRPRRSIGARSPVEQRHREGSGGPSHGETPGALWQADRLPGAKAMEPGNGDFDGGGASGDWGGDGGD